MLESRLLPKGQGKAEAVKAVFQRVEGQIGARNA